MLVLVNSTIAMHYLKKKEICIYGTNRKKSWWLRLKRSGITILLTFEFCVVVF